jgi:hypothetical protein
MDYIIHQPTSLVEWIVDPLSESTRGFSGVDCNPGFGPLKKAYSREIEHLIRRRIGHIDKATFFSAFYAAHQAAITERNIKAGFRGAGLAPFDPENVISKLDIQLRTPTPPDEDVSRAQPWTPRTRYNLEQSIQTFLLLLTTFTLTL